MKEKNNIKIIILMILSINFHNLIAQQREKIDCVVITVEQKQKEYPTETYYWMIPIDSMDVIHELPCNLSLFPIYLDASSEYNIKRCACGDTISYFNHVEENNSYKQVIDDFLKITKRNRLLLQTIDLKWNNKPKTKLTVEDVMSTHRQVLVYATPMSGIFADCIMQHNKELTQKVFSPVKDMKYNKSFWSLKHADLIKKVNFMFFDYTKGVPHSLIETIDIVRGTASNQRR
jgi:hypothetical protein